MAWTNKEHEKMNIRLRVAFVIPVSVALGICIGFILFYTSPVTLPPCVSVVDCDQRGCFASMKRSRDEEVMRKVAETLCSFHNKTELKTDDDVFFFELIFENHPLEVTIYQRMGSLYVVYNCFGHKLSCEFASSKPGQEPFKLTRIRASYDPQDLETQLQYSKITVLFVEMMIRVRNVLQ